MNLATASDLIHQSIDVCDAVARTRSKLVSVSVIFKQRVRAMSQGDFQFKKKKRGLLELTPLGEINTRLVCECCHSSS